MPTRNCVICFSESKSWRKAACALYCTVQYKHSNPPYPATYFTRLAHKVQNLVLTLKLTQSPKDAIRLLWSKTPKRAAWVRVNCPGMCVLFVTQFCVYFLCLVHDPMHTVRRGGCLVGWSDLALFCTLLSLRYIFRSSITQKYHRDL